MIRPRGFHGTAFGAAPDGDGRRSAASRAAISHALGIPTRWAYVRQVHGPVVVRVEKPGLQGEADAMVTNAPMLPMAVAVADCVPVVLEGDGAAGIAHAGWRGAAAGVVAAVIREMEELGSPAQRAAIGPGIGPCCFEVGPEVAARFDGFVRSTTWGTPSVDLVAALRAQLGGITVWVSPECTYCGEGYHSFRRDRTKQRQVAVAWVPSG